MGSLYAFLAADGEGKGETGSEPGTHHCNCAHQPNEDARSIKTPPPAHIENGFGVDGLENGTRTIVRNHQMSVSSAVTSPTREITRTTTTNTRRTSEHAARRGTFGTANTEATVQGESRRRVARAFEIIGDKLGTPAPDTFDDSEFLTGRAADFPTVPAEEQRNPELPQIMASYNPPRDSEGHATPNLALRRQRSRGGESYAGSIVSGLGIQRPESDEDREVAAAELNGNDPAAAGPNTRSSADEGARPRRDTLEVPAPTYLASPIPRKESSFSLASGSPGPDDRDQDPSSPAIRISHESVQ